MTIYDFKVKDSLGEMISMSQFSGKVLLIVNTATKCGLTPQYEALQQLYEKYKDQGLVVLDFPSNQFLEQAPGTDQEIQEFCTVNYGTTFPRFSKIDVNGENADPLFVWLKKTLPTDSGSTDTAAFEEKVSHLVKYGAASDIKWNFGKFLIDRNGIPTARYSPALSPEQLEQAIQDLLYSE